MISKLILRFKKFKFFLSLLITICFFFLTFSFQVLASTNVVINEFLANPTSPAKEWIEFYNPNNIDLSSYWLDDDTSFSDDSGSGVKKSLSSLNTSNSNYPYLEFSSFLNNDGDYVVLFSADGSIIDQYQYVSDPGKDVAVGRSPDGTGNWIILNSATSGGQNSLSSTPTPTPTPTPSPTPEPTSTPTSTSTPTPSSTKATYKINDVKDENGNVLSSVQIYVDNNYIHHLDAETITFCENCKCDPDGQVACGFGSHAFSLRKNGYSNWSEAKTLNAGDSYEINPIMQISSSTSSTATSTPTPTPKSTPFASPATSFSASSSSKVIATGFSLVLGESSQAATISTAISKKSDDQPAKPLEEKKTFTPILFILGGLTVLGAGVSLFWLKQKNGI